MQQAESQIAVPDDRDDHDSTLGDDVLSDTTSIASTIWNHRYQNGRRYAAYEDGNYWGPNDEQQQDQLDISHHMFTILLNGRLYLAPIKNPKRVLDLGTGTGIWVIDVADENEGAEVIGIDLSPIQPLFVPPNCKFEIDDISSRWTYPLEHFDLIHVRALYGSIADWPSLYQEIYDHLEPGGWVDQLEMDIQFRADDDSLPDDHVFKQWSKVFIDAGEKVGRTFKTGERAKDSLIAAGFAKVTSELYKVPLGEWSSDPKLKEIGKWNLLHCYQGAEGWGLFILTQLLQWTVDEARVFIAKFKQAMKDKSVHSYFYVYAVCGQKPEHPPVERFQYE